MPRKRQRPEGEADDDDGHDVHRISSEHLQQLYEEAKKDPLDELLFMLMLTTGLRVGGVTKVLTRNVAEVKNGQLVVARRRRKATSPPASCCASGSANSCTRG